MKKVFCLLVTFMVIFSFVGNVHASSLDVSEVRTEEIENDIRQEIEIARKEIYRQLEQQDALILMEVYENIIYPQIEQQIRDEYRGVAVSSKHYHAPNGGLVTYLSPLDGYKPTEVAVTCLNRDDSYEYLLNKYSFTLSDVIYAILGYIPRLGSVSSTVLNINGFADSLAISKIKDAGGCAQIINTYSREWGTKASLLTGWSDRYDIYVPSNATNVTFSSF